MSDEISTQPWTPSFGEQLVGINFNPAGDPNVNEAKKLFAKAADLLNDNYFNPLPPHQEHDALLETLVQSAIADILKAQMMVVKVLTYKK